MESVLESYRKQENVECVLEEREKHDYKKFTIGAMDRDETRRAHTDARINRIHIGKNNENKEKKRINKKEASNNVQHPERERDRERT